jgi:predicted MFS family arabinose efflux permease
MAGCLGCALGISVPFFSATLAALFAAALLNGMAFALFNVSQQNTVGMLSTPEKRTQAFATLTLVMSLGNFTGPLVAGFSIDHAGFGKACLYLAALGLVSAGLLQIGTGGLPKGAGGKHKEGGGVMELLRDRTMLKILLVGSVVMAGVDVFMFYVPIYTHGLGLSASTIGVIMACFSAAAFTSRSCLSWFLAQATPEQVLRRSFFLAAAAFILIPFFSNAVVLGMLSFAYGFGLCVGQPITMMLSFSNSADGRSGEVMGLRQSVNHGTRVIVPMIFGSIGSVAGLVSVFIVGAGMLASGGLMLRSGKLSAETGTK